MTASSSETAPVVKVYCLFLERKRIRQLPGRSCNAATGGPFRERQCDGDATPKLVPFGCQLATFHAPYSP
jgi:hypothetical protein